jgi:hypothetical protein
MVQSVYALSKEFVRSRQTIMRVRDRMTASA